MVLLSLAIVFAGLGIFSLTGSGDDAATETAAATTSESAGTVAAPAPNTEAAPAPAPSDVTDTDPTSAAPTTTEAGGADSIRVLNNSNVSGLAADTAQNLESAGFTVAETGNYSSGTISTSTVYYDEAVPGQQAEAERIATTLGYAAEPRFEGIASSPPGIIVMVTQ
ncbi:MAG: LytR C-terminal domain-containing protein [Rhodococcus sp. (in: high G+C Gram-positive bacteria)]